jgi:hypothetical protein
MNNNKITQITLAIFTLGSLAGCTHFTSQSKSDNPDNDPLTTRSGWNKSRLDEVTGRRNVEKLQKPSSTSPRQPYSRTRY